MKNFLGCLTQKMEALHSYKNFSTYLPADKEYFFYLQELHNLHRVKWLLLQPTAMQTFLTSLNFGITCKCVFSVTPVVLSRRNILWYVLSSRNFLLPGRSSGCREEKLAINRSSFKLRVCSVTPITALTVS